MDTMTRLAATATLAAVTRTWLASPFSAGIEEMAGTYRIVDSAACYARPAPR
jgi:hypothetical protein